jgi:hypothetical protein
MSISNKFLDGNPKEQLENEALKQKIKEWDPDFTKLTAEEAEQLRQADEELRHEKIYSENDIDWE